jgi:hypothetical protein
MASYLQVPKHVLHVEILIHTARIVGECLRLKA